MMILLHALGLLVFLLRLAFIALGVALGWLLRGCDWCERRCLETLHLLNLLDPTK